MPLVKVHDSTFVRDTSSMALINTDENAKNEYYSKVRLINNQKEELNKVKSEINDIKKDMREIKDLLSLMSNILTTK